jgi:hypothetical protein
MDLLPGKYRLQLRESSDEGDWVLWPQTIQVRPGQQTAVAVDSGVFTPVLAKHTKHLSVVDTLSVGVDRMQRNFRPMRKQVEVWKGSRLPDEAAKLIIYRGFVEGELDVPKHLARRVHDLYFSPQIEEFAPRTAWSLSNAFTSAFKELDPIPQFKATAKLGSFLELATASSN